MLAGLMLALPESESQGNVMSKNGINRKVSAGISDIGLISHFRIKR